MNYRLGDHIQLTLQVHYSRSLNYSFPSSEKWNSHCSNDTRLFLSVRMVQYFIGLFEREEMYASSMGPANSGRKNPV